MVPQPSTYSALGLLVLGLSLVLALGLYVALTFRALRRRMRTGVDAFMGGSTGYRSLIMSLGLAVAIFLLGAGLHAFLPPLNKQADAGRPANDAAGRHQRMADDLPARGDSCLLCIYLNPSAVGRTPRSKTAIRSSKTCSSTETPQHMSGAIAGAGRGESGLWLGLLASLLVPPAGLADGARNPHRRPHVGLLGDMYVRQAACAHG